MAVDAVLRNIEHSITEPVELIVMVDLQCLLRIFHPLHLFALLLPELQGILNRLSVNLRVCLDSSLLHSDKSPHFSFIYLYQDIIVYQSVHSNMNLSFVQYLVLLIILYFQSNILL